MGEYYAFVDNCGRQAVPPRSQVPDNRRRGSCGAAPCWTFGVLHFARTFSAPVFYGGKLSEQKYGRLWHSRWTLRLESSVCPVLHRPKVVPVLLSKEVLGLRNIDRK